MVVVVRGRDEGTLGERTVISRSLGYPDGSPQSVCVCVCARVHVSEKEREKRQKMTVTDKSLLVYPNNNK